MFRPYSRFDMDIDFSASDLKHYPHFDRRLSVDEAKKIISDPSRVASNKFYPFFLYTQKWQPFRNPENKGQKPDPKTRPIRYSSRRDAYIFTHYRRLLAREYESKLLELGIENCPIAYRKIKKLGGSGKCNIDFAKDAFDEIEKQKDCVAVALDIKSYFESLNHEKIKQIWCQLLDVEKLPPTILRYSKISPNIMLLTKKRY